MKMFPSRGTALPTCLTLLMVLVAFAAPRPAAAQTDLTVEQKLLEELLRDGKYAQALAELNRLDQVVRPKGRPPKGPQQTALAIHMLMDRTLVQREMGRLDDAEKSLTEARRLFKSRDFQRALPMIGDVQYRSLLYYSLIDEEAFIRFDHMETARHERATAAAAQQQAGTDGGLSPDEIKAWVERFEQLDSVVRLAQQVRGGLSVGAAKADGPGGGSPYARAMLSPYRPRLLIGSRYLEASRLPFTLPADAAGETTAVATDETADEAGDASPRTKDVDVPPETPAERKLAASRQLRRAIEYLELAVEDADTVCAAAAEVAPAESDAEAKSLQSARKEAAWIKARAREALAEAVLLDGDPARARQTIEPAIAELRAMERSGHPALARPLVLDAEISLAEMRASIAAKDVVAAERQSRAALEALREARTVLEAADTGIDPAAPIRGYVAMTVKQAEAQAKSASTMVASRDAADAAARRALRAINAGESRPAAKPAVKPAPAPAPADTPAPAAEPAAAAPAN